MSGILALDLARAVGWAWASNETLAAWPTVPMLWRTQGPPSGIEGGVHLLPDTSGNGRLFAAFADWLADKITDVEPKLIVMEGPGGFIRQAFPAHLRRTLGLMGTVERIAWRRHVRVREVAPATIKKSFTGSGRATKADMIAEANARGFDITDDNHADALALLDHAALVTLRPPKEAA